MEPKSVDNYAAQIAALENLQPIPGKDRILSAMVCGQQVTVPVGHEPGELGVFCPVGSALSPSVLSVLNLRVVRDPDGKKVGGGYFEDDGRVVAVKMGDVKSSGFWLPLSSLRTWAEAVKVELPELPLGFEFSKIQDQSFCQKYVPSGRSRPAKPSTATNQKKKGKKLPTCPLLKEHADTRSLRKGFSCLEVGKSFSVTVKYEGTSGRSARFRNPKTLRLNRVQVCLLAFAAWIARLFGRVVDIPAIGYYGSRRVQFSPPDPHSSQEAQDYRTRFHNQVVNNLSDGMTAYYEIVGWKNANTPFQPRHNPAHTGDKAFIKRWGKDPFVYSYGLSPGGSKVVVYRITWTDSFGTVWEFSPEQIADWGLRAHIETPTVLFKRITVVRNDETGCWVKRDGSSEEELLPDLLESRLADNAIKVGHPHEGAILREEGAPWKAFKYHTYHYLCMKGKQAVTEADTEESEEAESASESEPSLA